MTSLVLLLSFLPIVKFPACLCRCLAGGLLFISPPNKYGVVGVFGGAGLERRDCEYNKSWLPVFVWLEKANAGATFRDYVLEWRAKSRRTEGKRVFKFFYSLAEPSDGKACMSIYRSKFELWLDLIRLIISTQSLLLHNRNMRHRI